MRPGFVFVGLFAVLTATYVLLDGTISSWMTFALQAVIVVVLLAAATCYRNWRARQRPPYPPQRGPRQRMPLNGPPTMRGPGTRA